MTKNQYLLLLLLVSGFINQRARDHSINMYLESPSQYFPSIIPSMQRGDKTLRMKDQPPKEKKEKRGTHKTSQDTVNN